VDWRKGRCDPKDSKKCHPVLSPVKNQGQCGSCWAFAATQLTETAYSLSHNATPPVLAPEQIVQCYGSDGDLTKCSAGSGPAGEQGCGGCSGGLVQDALKYVTSSSGLSTDSAYPYVSGTTGNHPIVKCHSGLKAGVKVQKFQGGTAVTEAELENAIATHGSASVNIDASSMAFMDYHSGVFSASSCGTRVDHAVVAVGYTPDYWIVKNSWGSSWGNKGFIYIGRAGAKAASKDDPIAGQDLCTQCMGEGKVWCWSDKSCHEPWSFYNTCSDSACASDSLWSTCQGSCAKVGGAFNEPTASGTEALPEPSVSVKESNQSAVADGAPSKANGGSNHVTGIVIGTVAFAVATVAFAVYQHRRNSDRPSPGLDLNLVTNEHDYSSL